MALQHAAMEIPERPQPGSVRGVTIRSVVIALALIPFNSYWLAMTETVWYAGFPTTISLFYNVVFIIIALTALNALVRRIHAAWALAHAELLTIYVILCFTSAMVSHDMLQVLTPIMTYAYEYARPENDWKNLFWDQIPRWLTVDGAVPSWLGGGSSTDPVRLMYEGGSSLYQPTIWKAWIVPAGMWTLFCTCLYAVTMSMNAIFRRRWIESERLTFPIVQLPFELTRPNSWIVRSRPFWIVFLIVFAIDILNGIKIYNPSFPQIPLTATAAPVFALHTFLTDWPYSAFGSGNWYLGFYPFALGLCLLLPTELAFSCWVFYFVFKIQRLICAQAGVLGIAGGVPFVEEQSFAGYVGLALFGVWASRDYLKGVWRTVMGRSDGLDDSGEPIRYRTAVLIILAGFGVLVTYGIAAGMDWWYAIAFFIIYLILSLSVSRIRAEMGLPAHDLHHAGPGVVLERIVGQVNLSRSTRVATEVFCWFNRAYRAHPAPHQIEAYKLCERTGASTRPVSWAMGAAIAVGCVAGFWALLHCMYRDGVAAHFMEPKVPLIFGREPWERLAGALNNPQYRYTGPTFAIAIGLAATCAMMFLNVRTPWWPIHPAGYAVSSSWAMGYLWCPMLIAWTVKTLVTRYGGNKAFHALVPIAFGLILGDMAGGCFWSLYALGVTANPAPYCIWGK